MAKDLFDYYDELPIEVTDVLNKYSFMEENYYTCQELVAELETIGYTCDYGLDGVPYGLKKMRTYTRIN